MGFQSNLPKFVILAVLDGWGIAPPSDGNAITKARKLNFDKLWNTFPHTRLDASGESVGLPRGEDGNTETGHLNLGAGGIVYQDLERINRSIADGSFFTNPTLKSAIENARTKGSNLHLMGLVGAGGVHSNIEHLYALVQLCSREKFDKVFIHIFTDGRDSPPTSSRAYLTELTTILEREKVGKISTLMGRYWAMDRDFRWDRTQKAYLALTKGEGNKTKDLLSSIEESYKLGKTDEFIEPTVVVDEKGEPVGKISENDSVIFFNFRIDRPRQLTSFFVLDNINQNITDFDPYSIEYTKSHLTKVQAEPTDNSLRGNKIPGVFFVTMTEYGKQLTESGAQPAFPPQHVDLPLSAVLANNSKRQLKVTESEKERFVTFYFNGLREGKFEGEEVIIIPSPKIPTYDLQPEMSASEVTDKIIGKLSSSLYNFCLVNFPNADMVGHTGNIEATVKGVEHLDQCLGKLSSFVLAYDGALVITADHGNAEEMINLHTGEMDTEHSTNPVPFIIVSKSLLGKSHELRSGILADVAPTVLGLMNIPAPSSMTGRNLLEDLTIF